MTAILCEYTRGLGSGLEEALPRTRWGRRMASASSSGGLQKLFSFGIHRRTKKKSILSTYLSSNCFSATGRSPPLILQLMFALVTIQEASTSLRGKTVKCDVIKIPFKINNNLLSPSRRYLEKILQSKRMNGQSLHSCSGSPGKR